MSCEGCDRAEAHSATGFFIAGCQACEARAIAQGPAAAKRESDPSLLQPVMRAVWADEASYRKGRALVWEWIKRFDKEVA